jgi:hypothetical protein
MVMAAVSLSRLFSQSIAGTALWRPLFCGGGTPIRQNVRHRTTSLLAVSERSNLISSDFQLSPSPSLPQRSNRVCGRASSGDKEPGGSAFVATSLASEAAGFVNSGMDHLLLWYSQFESIEVKLNPKLNFAMRKAFSLDLEVSESVISGF